MVYSLTCSSPSDRGWPFHGDGASLSSQRQLYSKTHHHDKNISVSNKYFHILPSLSKCRVSKIMQCCLPHTPNLHACPICAYGTKMRHGYGFLEPTPCCGRWGLPDLDITVCFLDSTYSCACVIAGRLCAADEDVVDWDVDCFDVSFNSSW